MASVFIGNTMKRVFIIPSSVSKDGSVKRSISINPGATSEVDKELIELHKTHSVPFKALIAGNHLIIKNKPFSVSNLMRINPESKKAPIQLDVDKKVKIKGTKVITAEGDGPEGTQGGE